MMPTLYLSNWSSARSKGHHGPGRKWTIMARPRRWEHGEGVVPALVPCPEDLAAAKSGEISVLEYQRRFVAMVQKLDRAVADRQLAPGKLRAYLTGERQFGPGVVVQDGDTLCCACSRDAAAKSECHRAWAAALLIRAGWRSSSTGARPWMWGLHDTGAMEAEPAEPLEQAVASHAARQVDFDVWQHETPGRRRNPFHRLPGAH